MCTNACSPSYDNLVFQDGISELTFGELHVDFLKIALYKPMEDHGFLNFSWFWLVKIILYYVANYLADIFHWMNLLSD